MAKTKQELKKSGDDPFKTKILNGMRAGPTPCWNWSDLKSVIDHASDNDILHLINMRISQREFDENHFRNFVSIPKEGILLLSYLLFFSTNSISFYPNRVELGIVVDAILEKLPPDKREECLHLPRFRYGPETDTMFKKLVKDALAISDWIRLEQILKSPSKNTLLVLKEMTYDSPISLLTYIQNQSTVNKYAAKIIHSIIISLIQPHANELYLEFKDLPLPKNLNNLVTQYALNNYGIELSASKIKEIANNAETACTVMNTMVQLTPLRQAQENTGKRKEFEQPSSAGSKVKLQ